MEGAGNDILLDGPRFDEPDLDRLSATIKRVSGITLPSHRRSMVASRLGRRLRDLRMGSLSEYLPLLDDAAGDEMASMLDAIVTNKTEFFREPDHFQHLRDTVMHAIGRNGSVRVLSAGCSSGEEPFSAAMCAREALGDQGDRVRIDAIDLSRIKLAQAKRGVFLDAAKARVGRDRLFRFFLKGTGSSSGLVKLRPEVAKLVAFRHHNLMRPLPFDYRFHAIFCCNVAIYFDHATQEALFARLYQALEPGGWLYLGLAESLIHIRSEFSAVGPSLYRRAE
jgi:chemotaxis protein methyltransferase CheR